MISKDYVFISYSRSDREYAKQLQKDLNSNGIDAWLDENDIPPGSNFNLEIDKGIVNASAVLVLLTPNSIISHYVESEYQLGINRYIPTIPLLFQECEIPRLLHPIQNINFTDNYKEGVRKLCNQLNKLPESHLSYLKDLRNAFIIAQRESKDPDRFQEKIDAITTIIGGWKDRIERHKERIASGLKMERQLRAEESKRRKSWKAERVVGTRLTGSESFKNRILKLEELGRQIEKGVAKIIFITGRAGIGKTALVVKLLSDIERNKWPHTTEGPKVDGIAYLSMSAGSRISLEQIFLKCARMMGVPSVERYWKNPSVELDEKISYLFSISSKGLYIISLDNLDDLLDQSSCLIEPQFCRFLELIQLQQSNIRVIITTREKIQFQNNCNYNLQSLFELNLQDGLPMEDAIDFLRDLDPQGDNSLAEASDSVLKEIVIMTHGVPRALQLFASILSNYPFINIQKLKNSFFHTKDVLKELVEDNFIRLDNNSRLVLFAITILKRAVPLVAVDFLLQDFAPGLDTPSIMKRLARTHTVTINRVTGEIALNEIDRDWIYSVHQHFSKNNAFPTVEALNGKAADYYHQQYLPRSEWHGIEDIRPQLFEIEHLIMATSYSKAFILISEIDPFLEMWGFYEHAVGLREKMSKHLPINESMQNLSRLGRLNALLGQIDKGKIYFDEAFEIARTLNDLKAQSYILSRLGSCAYDLGRSKESKMNYEKSLFISRQINDPLCEGMSLYGLGRYYRGNHEVELAIEHLELAVNKLRKEVKVSHLTANENLEVQYQIAQSLNNLGICFRVLCNLSEANRYYEQAKETMEQISDRGGKAYVLTNEGTLMRLRGNMSEALKLCQEALEIYFDIKDRWGEGNTQRNIGNLYSDLGELDKAAECFQTALDINRSVNNKKGVAITLLNMGWTSLRRKNVQAAIQYTQQSLDLLESIKAIRYVSYAATQLSWCFLIDTQLQKAIESAEKANSYQACEAESSALAVLGTTALLQGRLRDAEKAYVKVISGVNRQLQLTPNLYYAQYLNGYAQVGLVLVSNMPISEPLQTYFHAKENCSAAGILIDQSTCLATFGDHVPKLKMIQTILA